MLICKIQGKRHQKVALAASSVKVGAFDVIASEMLKIAFMITPFVYIVYTLAAAFLLGYYIEEHHDEIWQLSEWLAPMLLLVGFLPYGYCACKFGDQITFSWKKLAIVTKSSFKRGTYKKMKQRRIDMQKEVRDFSRKNLAEGGTFKEKVASPSGTTGVMGKVKEKARGRADHRFSVTPHLAHEIERHVSGQLPQLECMGGSDDENDDSELNGGGSNKPSVSFSNKDVVIEEGEEEGEEGEGEKVEGSSNNDNKTTAS